jgi:branched-chain amino acid transport system ATP-binding protein
MLNSKLLEVTDLEVFYGSIAAVKKIHFLVNSGEIVTLIGSNGAGKTSTLRALSGIASCRGLIHFRGQSLTNIPPHKRPGLGMAHSPEGRGVFPQMSVRENLLMGAYLKTNQREISEDMENCFSLFPRLRERLTQLAGTLSGGEQQMLAISRALMSRPKLLLLDEPSLGLAPIIVAQIFEIIKKLNQQGISILLVEQNARMALKVAHRAYVLETGRITCSGTGAELLANDQVQQAYLGM